MKCSICGGSVEWKGPLVNLTHTECSKCGEKNCQVLEEHLDDCDGEQNSCGMCGGDGWIMLSDAGPSEWGEDCFCEEDRAITCPECKGMGIAHNPA